MRDISQRHKDSLQSFCSLPACVQIWGAGLLLPTNAVSFLFLDLVSG